MAMTASPAYFSMKPSYLLIILEISSKTRQVIPFTSSGSSFSVMAVYPVRSEKMTVTYRLSPVTAAPFAGRFSTATIPGEASVTEISEAVEFSGCSWQPHSSQNRAPSGYEWPQEGHFKLKSAPHCLQNFASFRLSVSHFGHFIVFHFNL